MNKRIIVLLALLASTLAAYFLSDGMIPLKSKATDIGWLIKQTRSRDKQRAMEAKWYVICAHSPKASALYAQWIQKDAGTGKDMRELLEAYDSIVNPDPSLNAKLIPALEEVMGYPHNFWDYRKAFELRRKLLGDPVSPVFKEAEDGIINALMMKDKEEGKQKAAEWIAIILQHGAKDPDAGAVSGIALFSPPGKTPVSSDELREASIMILKGLPRWKDLKLDHCEGFQPWDRNGLIKALKQDTEP